MALAFALVLAAWPFAGRADPAEADPSAADRDVDYAAGKKAIEAKDWEAAVKSFARVERREPENADVQNFLGFAHRNLKKYDLAFTHYKRALVLDPRHKGALEYLGETYLLVGDLPGAEATLGKLREVCLLGCEQLEDLEKAVAAYKSSK